MCPITGNDCDRYLNGTCERQCQQEEKEEKK